MTVTHAIILVMVVLVGAFFAEAFFTLTNLKTQYHRPTTTATFSVIGMAFGITGLYGVLEVSLWFALPLAVGVWTGSFTTVLIQRRSADDAPDQLLERIEALEHRMDVVALRPVADALREALGADDEVIEDEI